MTATPSPSPAASTVHRLASRPLVRAEAERLADLLAEAPWPEATATGTLMVDEARDLWIAEAWYEGSPDEAALTRLLRIAGLADKDVTVEAVADTDWVRRSLEGLAPVTAGRFVVHGAHDRDRRPAAAIAVEIDAGTAFGTGHHGSTLGCLRALDRLLRRARPRSVLDVGCGSGVLAIAVARALRVPVVAADIDPQAVRVARANVKANAAAPLVRVVRSDGLAAPFVRLRAPYDLVFANILARPLVALAPAIAGALAQRGHAVLAGLTRGQERQVLAAYRRHGLVPAMCLAEGQWSTLVLSWPPQRKKHPAWGCHAGCRSGGG
jgi:ribosomal protein L11 methyltransferase